MQENPVQPDEEDVVGLGLLGDAGRRLLPRDAGPAFDFGSRRFSPFARYLFLCLFLSICF